MSPSALLSVLEEVFLEFTPQSPLATSKSKPRANTLEKLTLPEFASEPVQTKVSGAVIQMPLPAETKRVKPELQDQEGQSFIPQQAVIRADLSFTGHEVRIQGQVIGNIKASPQTTVFIEKRALITGSVEAGQIRIAGLVVGPCTADEIYLQSMCSVQGDISYTKILNIESGAEICGSIQKLAN